MGDYVMEIQNLSKQYNQQMAVEHASFQIRKGSICGLIGPNGAGKTTIMKMLGGLIHPTEGSMSFFGKSDEMGLANARKRMSFMIETPYAKGDMTARENLEKQRLQKGIRDKGRIDEVLKIVALTDTGNKKVKNFSLGMRQRLGIAIALLSKPEVMIMDEPINGLDPEGIVEIRELLKRLNEEEHITIVISSHILSELSLLCSDYIFIHKGHIRQTVTAQELEKLCQQSYHIHTDCDEKALEVLKQQLHVTQYELMEDGSILLYEQLEQLRLISKTLYDHGVVPIELSMHEANLEQFYMKMIEDNADE